MKKTLAVLLLLGPLASPLALGEDLLEIYNLALEYDAQLKEARANRDAALEARPLAKSRLLPLISAAGDAGRTDVNLTESGAPGYEGQYNSGGISLNMNQPIYHRDYWIQLEQADKQIAQAEAVYAAEEQDLMLRVSQAYFDVLGAQDDVDFSEASYNALVRRLEQTKQRFDVGLIAITDVHESQAGTDQARANLIRAKNQLSNAWEALYEIIIQDVKTLKAVTKGLPLTPPKPENMADWDSSAQQQNLGVLAALMAKDIARQEIDVQRSGHYPTFDLVASYGMSETDHPTQQSLNSNTGNIGVQFNLPIYAGGGVTSSTRQAQYFFESAQEALDKQRRLVKRLTRNAYRGVMDSISSVEALRAGVVSAESALEATQAGVEVGTRTTVDALNAESNLFQARRDHAASRYTYLLQGLQLKQAAGSLSAEDLKALNKLLK
ncbi:MAG: TolC family outer membrane protein [Gammaproteobacteria bacterium]|nr:TolC family outer membrane protein [Gammaproteobacteria bacterium]